MAKTGKARALTPLGVHTSIAGGRHLSVERAVKLGCTAMQIFGRNPRSWGVTPLPSVEAALFRKAREKAGIWPVAVHTTYLINLCSPSEELFDKSVGLFRDELGIAGALGADYLVTHLGSPGEMGGAYAVRRVLSALENSASAARGGAEILLENTSGAGSGFGSSLKDIGRILKGAEEMGIRAGLCFDTCHAFAAGYPMKTGEDIAVLIKAIDAGVGLKRLKLIHLNDSKGEAGSMLDRHEHIGKGKIGAGGLALFLNRPEIKGIPLILETPKKDPGDDPRNLSAVREIIKGDI